MHRMPDNPRWTRVYSGGWLATAMWFVSRTALVTGIPILLLGTRRELSDGGSAIAVFGFWVITAWAGFLVWRLGRYGTWSSTYGLRVDRLLRWDRLPWRQVRTIAIEPTAPILGWRLDRTVVRTTRDERFVLPGTNALVASLLVSDSPETARHRLERERRYYLGKRLPKRKRPVRPTPPDEIIDLRTEPMSRRDAHHPLATDRAGHRPA